MRGTHRSDADGCALIEELAIFVAEHILAQTEIYLITATFDDDLSEQTVHRARHAGIEFGQTAGIMGREADLDAIIDIAPFGMMIELLGDVGNLRHPGKGGDEIPEFEAFAYPVARTVMAPASSK